MDKYDGATEVKVNRRGRLSMRDPRFSVPTANDLVYLDDSPNYCLPNDTLGSLGSTISFFLVDVVFFKLNFLFILYTSVDVKKIFLRLLFGCDTFHRKLSYNRYTGQTMQ